MDGGGLQAEAVISLLDSTDPVLKETAWWIAGHRPEWGSALAGFFQERLAATNLTDTAREELQQKLVQFAENPAIQDLLAATACRRDRGSPGRAQRDGQDAGEGVALTLDRAARARARRPRAGGHAQRGLGCARGPAVQRRGGRSARRASACRSRQRVATRCPYRCAGRSRWRPDAAWTRICSICCGAVWNRRSRYRLRVAAAAVLEKAPLERKQLLSLTGVLANAGPLELPRLLPAFDRGQRRGAGARDACGASRVEGSVQHSAGHPSPASGQIS